MCRRRSDELQLLALQVPKDALVNCAKVLGVEFSTDAEVLPAEAARVTTGLAMTRRLAMISGRPAFKEDVYRSRVVPFLNWRPWWSNLPQELGSKFVTQLRYCLKIWSCPQRLQILMAFAFWRSD